MNIIAYLCKMVLCSAVLYGYYHLLLRNRRFHAYNRYYLLLATLLSLLLPLVHIHLPATATINSPLTYKILQVISVTGGEMELPETPAEWLTPAIWNSMGYLLYGIISASLLLALFHSVAAIRAITRKYTCTWLDREVRFFNTNEQGTPFSFLNAIYWNSAIDKNAPEGQQVLKHEWFHVKERHTLDILFLEICCALCWCNPFFFLIRKEMKAIHEFLADQYAIDESNPHAYMEFLVLKAIHNKQTVIQHYFFQSHLKRRIHMLLQPSQKKYNYASRLLVLPFIVSLFCVMALYATPATQQLAPPVAKQTITMVVDAAHGGADPGTQNERGVTEKELMLSLARKINALAANYNVKVIMTRNEDALPAGNNSLKARVQLAERASADLFVSLHVNAPVQNKNGQIFDIYVPSNKRGNLYKEQAIRFGSLVVAALKDMVPVKEQLQQRESEGVFVLDHAVCPAILVECGAMSNTNEPAFIESGNNQEAVARRILAAAVAYAGQLKN